jgi:hypothetical protein
MKHPVKLRSYRTQFAIETPVGLTASFVAKEFNQDGNVASIELLEGGVVLMRGNDKAWIVDGLNVGELDEQPEAQRPKARPAASSGGKAAA